MAVEAQNENFHSQDLEDIQIMLMFLADFLMLNLDHFLVAES